METQTAVEVPSQIKEQSLSIKVFKADGTLKKDYGVVAYWHRNPLKRALWRVKKWLQS